MKLVSNICLKSVLKSIIIIPCNKNQQNENGTTSFLTCDSASAALCLFFSFSVSVCFHLQTVTSEGHFTGLKLRLSPMLRLPRSGAQPRRTSMDSLFLRVPKASERGGDSKLGTLPPWRVYLREELLIMPSHCCFLIKLMISLVMDGPLDVY